MSFALDEPTPEQPICPISNDLCEHTHIIYGLLCAECNGKLVGEPTVILALNENTDRTGFVHLSCYDAHDDVLEMLDRIESTQEMELLDKIERGW